MLLFGCNIVKFFSHKDLLCLQNLPRFAQKEAINNFTI